MYKKFFSIIVPVYNGENYIKQCVDEILNQNFSNFELLVINDGSSDNTQCVLEEHFGNNDNVRLIETSNQGVSSARNEGIKLAMGKYVLFLDSDDKLVEDSLSLLYGYLQKSSIDVLVFGFSVFGDRSRKNDTAVLEKFSFRPEKGKVIEAILSTKENIFGYIWRAVYSTQLLKENKIYFENHLKISEDYLFLLQTIMASKELSISSEELYEYHLGESSMSNKYIPTLLQDMMWVNSWIRDNLVSQNPDLRVGYHVTVANTYIRFVQNSLRDNKKTFWQQLFEIKAAKASHGFQKNLSVAIKHLNEFDLKSKVGIILFKYRLELLYALLFKLKGK